MRLAILASLLFVAVSAQLMKDEGPSEEYQQKSAFYGVQYTKFGQLRTFDAAWNQILIINLPTFADYAPLLQELRTYCYMMNETKFGPLDYITGKQLKVPKEADSAHAKLIKSCRGYERRMRNTLKEMLFSAFNESLPNPTAPNHEIVDTITSKTDQDFKLNVRAFDSADFEIHGSNRAIFNPINTEEPVTTTDEPMNTNASFATNQSITDNAKPFSETVTETPLTSITPQTESALDASLPQNQIVANSYDEVLRQTNRLDNADHNQVHSRDKRFVFTTLGLACVALLSASFGAWGVSLRNAKKIQQLESQVSNLINIQRDQDTGSSLVTESLLELTQVNEKRFSNGSAQLDRVLRLQTTPTVIFLSDQASASFVDSIISSLDSDSLSIDYYCNVPSIIKLLFLSLLILVFFSRNLINRVYVSNHRGALRSCQIKYLITIDFVSSCHCFCSSSQQHVTLLYLLRVKKENLIAKGVTSFEVINKNQGLKIKNYQFSLVEKVECKGRNASGDVTLPFDVPISFDLNSLVGMQGRNV